MQHGGLWGQVEHACVRYLDEVSASSVHYNLVMTYSLPRLNRP